MRKYNDVQFQHNLLERETYALVLPKSNKFDKALEQLLSGKEAYIEFKLGISKVHPKDQYNKKVGRSVAQDKMKKVKGRLISFHTDVRKHKTFNVMVDDLSFKFDSKVDKECVFIMASYKIENEYYLSIHKFL